MTIQFAPLEGPFGARVDGVDIAAGVTERDAEAIRSALVEHKLLVARDQALGPAPLLALAEYLGTPTIHPVFPHLDGYPPIVEVINLGPKLKATSIWHSDVTFEAEPPSITMLSAQVLPESGGDTLFADQEAAFDALPVERQEALAVMTARHDGLGTALLVNSSEAPTTVHPVVRTHPVSAKRALFVNDAFTTEIHQNSASEAPTVRELVDHATDERFLQRHEWQPGDLVMWDNRSTLHFHVHDYEWAERRLLRITLAGDRPR